MHHLGKELLKALHRRRRAHVNLEDVGVLKRLKELNGGESVTVRIQDFLESCGGPASHFPVSSRVGGGHDGIGGRGTRAGTGGGDLRCC